jgi:hypothetical protein
MNASRSMPARTRLGFDRSQIARQRDVVGQQDHDRHADEGGDQPPSHAGGSNRKPTPRTDSIHVCRAELLAQRRDVGVDCLGRAVPVGVPHRLEDLGPGVDGADVVGQEGQQVELLGREGDLVAVDATRRVRRSNSSAPIVCGPDWSRSDGARLTVAGAAADGADARDQLAQAERLGDVVVGAQLEAEHAVELLAARCSMMIGIVDERCRSARQTSRPSHVGEPEVQQHQFVALCGKRLRPPSRRASPCGRRR